MEPYGWVWKSGFISHVSGDSTTAYNPEEGTPAVSIIGWAEDDRGNLWMATDGEGLYVKNREERWYNFNEDDGLPSNDCYDVVAMGVNVMLATDQGLVRCSLEPSGNKELTVINRDDGLDDQIVKKLFRDGDNLWIALYEQHINRIAKGGEIMVEKTPPGVDAHMIIRSGETTWWLSEAGHLYRSTANHEWQRIEIKSSRRTQIRHLALDKEGHLWVSTNKGLFLFDQWIENYPTAEAVTALCVKDSMLWYSQQGNLYKYNLITGSGKKVWAGPNLILSLHADDYGRVWAGTFDGGVMIWNTAEGHPRFFNESNGLVNNNVLSIDGNKEGVWLGTLGGVSHFPFKGDEIFAPKSYDHIEGVGVQYIYAVHVNDKGQVFLATDGDGVLHWDGEYFRPLSINLPKNVVLDITSDPEGRLWWITPDGHLHSWSPAEGGRDIPSFESESGKVAGLLAEPGGDILVFHEGGMHRWSPVNKRWTSYGKSFGMGILQPELHAQKLGPHHFLFSGTADGITALRLDLLPRQLQPSTHLMSKELFFEPTTATSFSSYENHITFKYTGRWYTDPEGIRYKLKLQGYDLDWVISQNNSITYPQLPPGHYTFSVVAGIDGYFPEDQLRQFSFEIRRPWYDHWYIFVGGILLLALAGYLLGRFRMKEQRKKQEQEQQRVRAQYEALKSQVNPHFLFNSFNTLMALIEDDKEEATQYLAALSDFFRNILKFREIDLISVDEELEIVKTYLNLQERRFGSNLHVEIDVPEKIGETEIPPLTLQLLVENAFKHNVISKLKPLRLRIYSEGDYLVVWNVLQEKNQRDVSTGYGLDSIRKKYMYHTKRNIQVECNELHFAVYLPLIPKT